MLKIPNKLEPATRAELIEAGEKIEPENRDELFRINARLGGDCIVNISREGAELKADKTFDEIVAADAAGQTVRLVYGSNRYYIAVCDEESVKFSHARWTSGNKMRLNSVTIFADDTVEENMGDFTPSSIPG